jgi:hypothetical protein
MDIPELVREAEVYARKLERGVYTTRYLKMLERKYKGSQLETFRDPLRSLLSSVAVSHKRMEAIGVPFVAVEPSSSKEGVIAAECLGLGHRIKRFDKGWFGSVYDLPDHPDRIAKIERVDALSFTTPRTLLQFATETRADPLQRIKEIREIGRLAEKLGVGPRVHKMFVCEPKDGAQRLVTIMQRVPGVPWSDWRAKNNVDFEKAVEMLRRHIVRLGEAGILHLDLHNGNVMVETTKNGAVKAVKLIDFNMASFVNKFEEHTSLLSEHPTNDPGHWLPFLLAEKGVIKLDR